MDHHVLDKFLAEFEKKWQATLGPIEAREEESGPHDDNPTPECDHAGHYRLIGGLHVAIRMCTQCGKSWRLPTQGDYLFGDHPVAEWEEIREGLEVEPRVLPDYEE